MHGLPFAHSVLVSSAGCYDVRWVPQQRAGTAKTARMGVRDPRGPSAFCMYICKTARAMSVLRIARPLQGYIPAPGPKDQLCMTRQLTGSDMYVRGLIALSGLSVLAALACRMVFGCIRHAPCLQGLFFSQTGGHAVAERERKKHNGNTWLDNGSSHV